MILSVRSGLNCTMCLLMSSSRGQCVNGFRRDGIRGLKTFLWLKHAGNTKVMGLIPEKRLN